MVITLKCAICLTGLFLEKEMTLETTLLGSLNNLNKQRLRVELPL